MAARVFRLKKQDTLNVVAGAADLIGATALISPLLFDKFFGRNPERIGLKFRPVGNNEFDKGTTDLRWLQADRRTDRCTQLPRRQRRHAGAI